MEWLLAAQDSPGIILSFDPVERKEIFKAGEASYYAGEASELTELQQAIGSSVLRVAPFPAGPAGEPRTQLQAEGVMVNPATLADPSGQQADLALEFGRFLTNQENQEQLMRQANLAPGHINVNAADYPAVAGFLQQAETAGVWGFAPRGADVAAQQEANRILDAMIERVVFGRENVAEVVDEALANLQKLREAAE
jgi:ABC-type glycerol-3-phosphate transport system substrate-binding protein